MGVDGDIVIPVRGFESSEPSSHMQQLAAELWVALQKTNTSELAGIASSLPRDFVVALGRRSKNLASSAAAVVGWVANEVAALSKSSAEGSLGEHLSGRTDDAADAAIAVSQQIAALSSGFLENPREQIPKVLLFTTAALLSGGGVDGDGGIPDSDISLFGIGEHRSPVTHSILMGAALEALAMSLLRCICVVHKNLPANRHPIWDKVTPQFMEGIETMRGGASLGLAYHFLVDGLVEPAPYHGLPIEMPLEAHQAIFAANGVAEALSVPQKCSPAECEKAIYLFAHLALLRGVLTSRHLHDLIKIRCLDYLLRGSCVRSTHENAEGLPPKWRPVAAGTRLRCAGCNRTKSVTPAFCNDQLQRLGRPLRQWDLRRLVCTKCRVKGSFEPV